MKSIRFNGWERKLLAGSLFLLFIGAVVTLINPVEGRTAVTVGFGCTAINASDGTDIESADITVLISNNASSCSSEYIIYNETFSGGIQDGVCTNITLGAGDTKLYVDQGSQYGVCVTYAGVTVGPENWTPGAGDVPIGIVNISGDVLPDSSGVYSLGASGSEFSDLFIDGRGYVDTLITDTISENTSGAGVTVDSVLLKDGQVTTDSGDADNSLIIDAGSGGVYRSGGLVFQHDGTTYWKIRKLGDSGSDLVVEYFNDSGSELGDALTIDRATGDLTVGGDLITVDVRPQVNNSYDLGSPTYRWANIYSANAVDVGHVTEHYSYNPNYTYQRGMVVQLDVDGDFEVKPAEGLGSRVLGVVDRLPYLSCVAGNCTFIDKLQVVIYGRYHTVLVEGHVSKGDYLVASDVLGVATSMYNIPHPLNPSICPASHKKENYNLCAKLLPTVGLAMEDYEGEGVGVIKAFIGK